MCKICVHPNRGNMIVAYAELTSYRKTAERFGVDFRTLQRFITRCVVREMAKAEEDAFRQEFDEATIELTKGFTHKRRKRPPTRVTKPIKWSWSRRAWGA